MFTPEIREVPWKQGIHVSNIFWLVPNLFEVEDKVDWFQSTIQTIFTQRFYPLNRNRGKRQSQSSGLKDSSDFLFLNITLAHNTNRVFLDSESYRRFYAKMSWFKMLVDYSIGKVWQKTNARLLQHRTNITKNQHSKKIKFGQEWPINFFESRRFYLVGGGRGNKQYLILAL